MRPAVASRSNRKSPSTNLVKTRIPKVTVDASPSIVPTEQNATAPTNTETGSANNPMFTPNRPSRRFEKNPRLSNTAIAIQAQS